MPIEIIAGAVAAKEVATVAEIAKEIAAQVASQAENIQASEIVSQSERIREISDFKIGEDPSNGDLSSLRSEEMSAGEEIATQLESGIPTEELSVEANLSEQTMEMVSAEQTLGDMVVQNFEISANSLTENASAQTSPQNISDIKTPLENEKDVVRSTPAEQNIEDCSSDSDTLSQSDVDNSTVNNDASEKIEQKTPESTENVEYKDIPRANGEWSDVPGDSSFRFDDEFVPQKYNPEHLSCKEIAKKYGKDHLEAPFDKGEPDFSDYKLPDGDVVLKEYSQYRDDNYDAADYAKAEDWTKSLKDGKTWTADDVAQYRCENELSWHEKGDMKTMELVPREIHLNFHHSGGIAAAKAFGA